MVTRAHSNRRSRTVLRVALATVAFAVAGVAVARSEHRSIEQAYAAALATGPGRPAQVETLLHAKQSKTLVGVRLDGREHTVRVAADSHDLRVGTTVEVHRTADERVPLAIAGTEPWSWWGTMVEVFGALGVAALVAAVVVVARSSRHVEATVSP